MNKKIGLVSVGIVLVAFISVLLGFTGNKLFVHHTVVTTPAKSSEKLVVQKDLPSGKVSDWNLVLVNFDHKVKDLNPPLKTLANGYQIDKRIAKSYDEMSSACQKAGYPLEMVSAFRSVEEQKGLVAQNIQENVALGMSEAKAKDATMKVMTVPGYSEHNTGLAVDVVSADYYNEHINDLLKPAFAKDPGAKWLAVNAPKYGFILRYPKGATGITHIDFEPWHFRYVGKAAAEYITNHHITLEQYVSELEEAGR